MMAPHILGGGMAMAAPQMMMTQGPSAMQGRIVILGGKAFMLEACDPRSVYCNALDDFEPLAEGSAANGGPAKWNPPYMVDPSEVDPWLSGVGQGIY
eukprot:CAMPEP_0179413054 /NCGR_PEP_ID=MMETSP0799-20121207/4855_1 /TAXON_ID=46947 /ORGANISM="Geminigera cryophila, Strain CCMP2564" /LENGTH=96 /DNA_ID=CAMNT_0021185423 /DNA_START=136 /DNA_END=426 /DNA_ORIENTATION=+